MIMTSRKDNNNLDDKNCPKHCGNPLQFFMHNCPNTANYLELFGCPLCDDSCQHCFIVIEKNKYCI